MEFLQHWQGLAVFIMGAVLAWGGTVFRSQVLALVSDRASKAAVDNLLDRLEGQETRMATMEAAIRHLPTADQMHALSLSISDLRGDVKSVGSKVQGVEALVTSLTRRVELIDEHLSGKGPGRR